MKNACGWHRKALLRSASLAERHYLPSYKRADNPPPMRITPRDRQIVRAVYEHRLLSAPQIEALFFRSEKPRGRQTSCQRRLQLLFHHGFLDRIALPIVMGEGRAPYVYALDDLGANLVAAALDVDRAAVDWRPKHNQVGHQFVTHTLAVNDFRVAIALLAEARHFIVNEWISEAEFSTVKMRSRVPFRMRGARVIRNYPDGYFRLSLAGVEQEAHFFLETDQGTMSNASWQEKVQAYREFRLRGLSQQHFGTQNFRVLAPTTGARRMQNLKRATERAGGDLFFWFTCQDRIDIWNPEQLLDPIWEIATQSGEHSLLF